MNGKRVYVNFIFHLQEQLYYSPMLEMFSGLSEKKGIVIKRCPSPKQWQADTQRPPYAKFNGTLFPTGVYSSPLM